ncbi:MAG TPA: hypothetical protein VEL28_20760 [Candidatus Binatia bacterium]|nr:hypothetical protein [Candidatus Binatia bacterium]
MSRRTAAAPSRGRRCWRRLVHVAEAFGALVAPRRAGSYRHRLHAERRRRTGLPGFLGEADTIALYESLGGRRHDLHYYQVWAGLRFSVVFIRIIQRMQEQGVLVPGWPEKNNICTQFLAKVGGFAEPR